MLVKDVMTPDVVSVAPDTPYKDVVETLVRAGVSCVPVIDDSERLLGIVTEADLVSKEAYVGRRRRALGLLADVVSGRAHHWATKAKGLVATEIMSRDVVTCEPRENIRVAARRMLERRVKRLPVVHHGALVGVVSRQDILRTLDRPDEEIAGAVEARLSSPLDMPDDHHVRFSVDHGVVTLSGDVRYGWDKQVVVSVVRDVEGVIEVVDHLHNREPDPNPPVARPGVMYRST
jgi:CBS domain-containing protein